MYNLQKNLRVMIWVNWWYFNRWIQGRQECS